MKTKDFTYPSSDGRTTIHGVLWEPDEVAVGVIQIVHGMTEYIWRYGEIARFFTDYGYAVAGNDLTGHGESIIPGAQPMYFGLAGSWNNVVEDLHFLHHKVTKRYPAIPHFILGFSLGSFLTRDYISHYPYDFRAVVLVGTGQYSAPALWLADLAARAEARKHGEQNSTRMIHRLTFESYNRRFKPTRTEMDWLCENQKLLDQYLADPKRGKSMSAGMFREFVYGMKKTGKMQTIRKMCKDVPVLIISGASDPVGDFGKGAARVKRMFQKAGISAELKIYSGRHDILREECAGQVLGDIVGFWGES